MGEVRWCKKISEEALRHPSRTEVFLDTGWDIDLDDSDALAG